MNYQGMALGKLLRLQANAKLGNQEHWAIYFEIERRKKALEIIREVR